MTPDRKVMSPGLCFACPRVIRWSKRGSTILRREGIIVGDKELAALVREAERLAAREAKRLEDSLAAARAAAEKREKEKS